MPVTPTLNASFSCGPLSDLRDGAPLPRNTYRLYLLTAGQLHLSYHQRVREIEGTQLLYQHPYQTLAIDFDAGSQGHYICFHTDFYCVFQHEWSVPTLPSLFYANLGELSCQVQDSSTLDRLFQLLTREQTGHRRGSHEAMVALLKVYLIESVRHLNEPDSHATSDLRERYPTLLSNFIDLIEASYHQLHTPAAYARQLYCTPRTLNRLARKYLHITASQLIIDRIMLAAKRFLYLTSHSIGEIAVQLGYDDAHYFSRVFKRVTGVSPSRYRQRVGQGRSDKLRQR